MQLDPERHSLLSEAEGLVRRFIQERGQYSLFALVKYADGKQGVLQSSEEFTDLRSALVEVARTLLTLAHDGTIVAAVICTPFDEDGRKTAMFDVESRAAGRTLVLLPYKKQFFGGWKFGEKVHQPDSPKLFPGSGGVAASCRLPS